MYVCEYVCVCHAYMHECMNAGMQECMNVCVCGNKKNHTSALTAQNQTLNSFTVLKPALLEFPSKHGLQSLDDGLLMQYSLFKLCEPLLRASQLRLDIHSEKFTTANWVPEFVLGDLGAAPGTFTARVLPSLQRIKRCHNR